MLPFHKYQGAGNDFVLVDQRAHTYLRPGLDTAAIAHYCHRRFGIGADGLILLEADPDYDFAMRYFNADGRESTLCGNGGRCIVAFAHHLGLIGAECEFRASDGPHRARIDVDRGWVALEMREVAHWEGSAGVPYVLNTGSPHYVEFVPSLENLDVVAAGRRIRYSARFTAEGINVNFVAPAADGGTGLHIATYERGVEDETLACGTGVTAAALAWLHHQGLLGSHHLQLQARGGLLEVDAHFDGVRFSDIWLGGPAALVFTGVALPGF